MKKLILLVACLFSLQFVARADDDKPVQVNQLPQKAQQFIQDYFSVDSIAFAKVESDLFDKSYEVIFTNGTKLDFNRKGEWKEVDCKHSRVPAGIVPAPIQAYLDKHHRGVNVIKIDVDKRDYEVKLSNKIELKFDKKFNVIGYDR